MDCKTANQLIHPYIDRELDPDTADSFLKHVRECRECREELEIYFTVQTGIHNLNRDRFQTYDLKGQFEEELRAAQAYLRQRRLIRGTRDIMLALAIGTVAAVCMLQLSIWF